MVLHVVVVVVFGLAVWARPRRIVVVGELAADNKVLCVYLIVVVAVVMIVVVVEVVMVAMEVIVVITHRRSRTHRRRREIVPGLCCEDCPASSQFSICRSARLFLPGLDRVPGHACGWCASE